MVTCTNLISSGYFLPDKATSFLSGIPTQPKRFFSLFYYLFSIQIQNTRHKKKKNIVTIVVQHSQPLPPFATLFVSLSIISQQHHLFFYYNTICFEQFLLPFFNFPHQHATKVKLQQQLNYLTHKHNLFQSNFPTLSICLVSSNSPCLS